MRFLPQRPRRTATMSEFPAREPTILLVEDEELIRVLANKFLTAAGYQVLVADSGSKGVELGQACPDRIDLLITDLMMPGITGWEVARRLRLSRPDLRVLFMTGYAGSDHAEETPIVPPDELLAKPFLFEHFMATVRRLLV
jgi:two-component system cell cycle sensor histidine kinase/response regulator CckA